MIGKTIRSYGDPEAIKKIEEYVAFINRGVGLSKVSDDLQARMNFPLGFDHTGRAFTEEDTERNYRRMFGPKE
jgi:hypothetical protein